MFRMIGVMVVYGFALYGLIESADWLTDLMDRNEKAKPAGEDVADRVREELRKHGGMSDPA
ncbi:MAG: hypothetical protein EOP84_10820 [Verrucomicrobiaceae bacterium]|nr:MAG: hypothetical protein EOP84_10820 [Verrucomicrobiaceae bacterium]